MVWTLQTLRVGEDVMLPTGTTSDRSRGTAPSAAFAMASTLAQILDQMPVGIVLVDRSSHVVFANLSARLLVGDGIALREGRLVATEPEPRDALASLVRRAIDAGDEGAPCGPEALMVPRSSGSTPLVLVVRPLEASGERSAQGAALAVIYVSDPERGLRASRERLRQLFGLSRAEAELVALLAQGYGVREASARLGVTQETARTYVKRAFQKTGVRRQAELVRLALAAATAGALDA
jgi:DNA-binding CsgD family transcriptional regulator